MIGHPWAPFQLTLASLDPATRLARPCSIGDGDTISVLERGQKLKVRLACIDAPETAQTPFGVASCNQLKALLPIGSTVSLRIQAVDRYGRSVAEVIGKGPVNLVMVQSGQAFVYRQYLGRCDRGAYLGAERQAQAQRLGVWAVPGGITRPRLQDPEVHAGLGHNSTVLTGGGPRFQGWAAQANALTATGQTAEGLLKLANR